MILGITELKVQSFSFLFSLTSADLFSAILWKSATACCLWFVLSQTAGTANPMRALQTLNNEVHRAPVTSYEEYLATEGLCFSNSLYNNSEYAENSPYFDESKKKVIGKFKDEASGVPINEFIGFVLHLLYCIVLYCIL